MCTPTTASAADSQATSGSLHRFWQTLTLAGPGSRPATETIAHLSPHMRRDIGLDDGRATERRNAANFTNRHGLAP